jgi:hypothetical protein
VNTRARDRRRASVVGRRAARRRLGLLGDHLSGHVAVDFLHRVLREVFLPFLLLRRHVR